MSNGCHSEVRSQKLEACHLSLCHQAQAGQEDLFSTVAGLAGRCGDWDWERCRKVKVSDPGEG